MISAALAQLLHLRRLGFRDEPILDEYGVVQLVCFARTGPRWREVVIVYSEHQARAYRLRRVEPTANPLRVDPAALERLIPPADVVSVVHALLTVPLAGGRERIEKDTNS